MRIQHRVLCAVIAAASTLHAQETPPQGAPARHAAVPPKPMTAEPAEKPQADDAQVQMAHHDHAAMPAQAGSVQAIVPADHIPPDPPQHAMAPMSNEAMTRVMQMDDAAPFFMVKVDEFERAKSNDAVSTAWNAQAWYGGDVDKLWLRTEGEREAGVTEASVEALWNHAFASFWDWQLGVRHDFGSGSARDWAAFGVHGLAPYWFDIEAMAYVDGNGRGALRLRAEYDILLTQRLILAPEAEVDFYGQSDRARGRAAGLSDAEFGLRLRYEIRREFAPYVGVVRKYRRGMQAPAFGLSRIGGSESQIVAGLRLWF
ncbi:MAG: copper resistance protein B [Proteobacteria bacterium]|mgnify:CR=1 FL=1|nr:copper resistance protein B [Pseudomonadota bacterium]